MMKNNVGCYNVNNVCCCKFVEKKLNKINYFDEEVPNQPIVTSFKIINERQPLIETRQRFKQKYSGIVRDLEEAQRKKFLNVNHNSYSPAKQEKNNSVLMKPPKSNIIGPRKCYNISPKIEKKQDLLPERYFNYKNNVEEIMLIKTIEDNNLKNNITYDAYENENQDFYNIIEYDCSSGFYDCKTNSNCAIKSRNEQTYFLKEIPYLYVTNYNKGNMPAFRLSKQKKVRFTDDVQVLEYEKSHVKNLLKKLKSKLKLIFDK